MESQKICSPFYNSIFNMIFNLNKLKLKSVCGVVAVLALAGLASCNSDDDYAELSMA